MFKIQKLDFLIAFYITCVMISELMGAKTFPIATLGSFPLHATVVIFILPFIYAANDIIVEVFGKERAQSVVRSSLVMIFFLLLFSLLATALPPSARFAQTNTAYNTMTLAFYALDQSIGSNLSFIAGLAIPYWLLRCCMSIIETPLVYLGVKWLKKEK